MKFRKDLADEVNRFYDAEKKREEIEAERARLKRITQDKYAVKFEDYCERLKEEERSKLIEAIGIVRGEYESNKKIFEIDPKAALVVVGSSVVRADYKDIDLALVGISDKTFRENLFGEVKRKLNPEASILAGNFIYSPHLSVSQFEEKGKYLIDFIVDGSGNGFDEWHDEMFEKKERYCLVERFN
jgi:hypothetical protein